MSNSNNNRNEMNRQFSRHVPDEWDFEVPNGENKSQIKENFKNVKIKKAFIVGNNYGGSIHFDNDATKISEILQEKCGYSCTIVLNEPNLKKKFQEYLNSFKFTEINIDFIFYYSGHTISKKNGLEFEIENNPKLKSKKLYISLNEMVEMVENREKEIQAGCVKLLDLNLVFKKLFILECCRLNDDSPIDQYIPIFKKYQKDVETQFKESKNLSFLYSTNLGENNQTNYWSECISTFTDSLIGRISSPRAPGRNLKTMGQIISEDLLNRYKNSNMGDFSKQYKMWFSGLNMFSLSENDNNSIFGGNGGAVAENVIPELFEKFVKEKFNVLFGDKGMNKFVLVENEDPLEVMKKQKQFYLKNRQKQLLSSSPSTPALLSSSSCSIPVVITTSSTVGKSVLGNSGGIDYGSPNWNRANFMTQSAPNVPLSMGGGSNSGGNSPKLFIGSNKFRSDSPIPSYSPIQSEGYEDSTIECDIGQSSSSSSNTNSNAVSPTLISNKSNSSNSSTYEFATNNNMFLKKEGDWRVSNQQLL